ncbi:MAG: SusC/RagA family TonB-linked outer membrane protein [Prevotella sp.]|jgi:TonB-linked SusC/RagA family outer membrane protein
MKRTLLLFGFILCTLTGWSQRVTIQGHVTDGKEPVIGATVQVLGSNSKTVTDVNGNYKIQAPVNSTLQFNYIGFSPVKKKVRNGKNTINIQLTEDLQKMDEVVVTALNIKRNRRSLGYSTEQVDQKDLNVGNDANMLNQLTGKVAGVQITAGNSGAGSSSRVVIRGENSFSTNNQPLYVVDGVPIENNTFNMLAGTPQQIDYGNGAGELNPDDIASITVLKGANAAALYGSRAANGVILITSKSGTGKDKFRVDVNSTTTFENVARLPEYQNKYSQGLNGVFEYWDGANGHGGQDQQDMSWGREMDGSLVAQYDSPSIGPNGEQLRGGDVLARNGAAITPTPLVPHPDNVKDFFETGVTQNTNIALSANNQKGSFRLSYTNLYSKGAIPNVDLKRNTFSINTNYDFTPKFHAKAVVNYINERSDNRPSTGYGPENPMYMFAWCARNMNIDAEREYWQRGYVGLKQYHTNSGWNDNPFFTMYENTNGFDKNRVYGNIMLRYDILPNLTLTARTGIDYANELRQSKRAYSTQRFPTGAYKRENVYSSEWNTDLLLQYSTIITSDINMNLTGGVNSMIQKGRYDYGFANGLSVPGVYNLGNASGIVNYVQRDSKKRINSLFFTGDWSYKDFLFLNVTARNDWSSALTRTDGSGNNSYFYPSVSLSVVLSDMFKLPEFINYWSVRTGYAEVGSDTDPYRLQNAYAYATKYGSVAGIVQPTTLADSELKPERLHSWEIGTDISLLNNRIGLNFTYYNSLNSNQIVVLPISTTTGYTSRYVNAGEIRNQGVEISLSLVPFHLANSFKWMSKFNFSRNVGRVEKLAEGYDQYVYSWSSPYDGQDSKVYAIARKGERMGNIYGTGFKHTPDGKILVDNSGLPVADPTLVKLGNYNPDFILGWQNKFNYKGFSLEFLLDWHQGGVFVSRTYGMCMESGVLKETEDRTPEHMVIDGEVYNENTGTYVQNTKQVSPRDYYRNLYRRFHETQLTFSATFIKLREISLGYTFPERWFQKTPIKQLGLSIVGRNLFMWTKDQDTVDPEVVDYKNGRITPGVEEMSYPTMRSIGFSIHVTL